MITPWKKKRVDPLIVAVDFDGTLVTDEFSDVVNDLPDIGKPNWEAISFVKELKKTGALLILWTCRNDDTPDLALTKAVEFCRDELGLEFDAVNDNLPWIAERLGGNSRKIYADLYLDDKTINPLSHSLESVI